jgi:hypothetical protein
MPMMVMSFPALSSNTSDFSERSFTPSVSRRRNHARKPVFPSAQMTRSLRKSNQISSNSTIIRYHAYTNPNIAIADRTFGVRKISKARSGWPRCARRGSGAAIRNASAVTSESRYVGCTSFTLKTRASEARMNAPATSPVR